MGPREGVTDGVGVTGDDRDELNGKHQTSSECVTISCQENPLSEHSG